MNVSLSSLTSVWTAISPLILNLVLAIVYLLVGLLVARVLGFLTTWVLKLVQLDKGAKRIGFNTLLEKGDLKKTSSELLGDLVYWVVVFVVVVAVAGVLGLSIEPVLSGILSYMGIVFLAALVLGIGAFLASLISGIVQVVAGNIGILGSKIIARIIYYTVIIFTFLVALAQLGIKTEVFVPQLGVIIGAVGLAAAIAFGLGCKDMAADFLHNLFKGK